MHRVFTDQELVNAGRLTVELIDESLHSANSEQAITLVRRFEVELRTMFLSYTGWEKSILGFASRLAGTSYAEQLLAHTNNYDAAPERQVATDGVLDEWINTLKHIRLLINSGESLTASQLAHELRERALELHDGLMSRVAALLSKLYDDYGEARLREVYSEVMRPEAMDPDGKLPFREKVENIMMFTRSHLLPFTVSEDAEKVTFMPDPCPSGARLIRQGHYEAPRNGSIVREAGPLSYGRAELPVYCCHEPSMEISSILRTGVPLFLVDPPEDIGVSPCKIYVYKDPANIPAHFYKRLGLEKPDSLIASSS